MSKYASDQKFAGQRASVSRSVIVGSKDGPQSGAIAQIDNSDRIYIFVPPVGMSSQATGATRSYDFKVTVTEQDADTLAEFEWSWPPRV
jgi:hypothetical protein